MKPNVRDNPDRKRFEYETGNQIAYVEYIINNQGMIFLTHTEVPPPIKGRGFAFDMIHQVLKDIEQRNLKLFPLCPVVATFIRRNPEWKKLLADNVNV